MKIEKFVVPFMVISLLFSSSNYARAEEESLEDRLEALEREASEQKEKTFKIDERLESVSEQLRVLEENVNEATFEYNEVKNQLDKIVEQIEDNEELLTKTEKDLAKKKKVLAKRARNIYIHGKVSYLDLLFGAKDFSDLVTRMELLTRILKYDFDLVDKVREQKRIVAATKKALEKDKEAQSLLVTEAADKRAILIEKKRDIDRKRSQLEYDRETTERAYEELLQASKEVERMIRMRDNHVTSTITGRGGLLWPLAGEITCPFGWRIHPIHGATSFHTGVDIGGDYGDPICAAASGTVIYAGWISGYGNTVIIEHGGGISTLYAHAEALAVSEGQSVAQGEVISYCGSTGNSTGPHCHFEIRENGEPVDPLGYY